MIAIMTLDGQVSIEFDESSANDDDRHIVVKGCAEGEMVNTGSLGEDHFTPAHHRVHCTAN